MPNATVGSNAQALPDAHQIADALKHREAEDVRQRFFDLDEILQDAVVWTSLLDKIAEEMAALPSMSKREVNIVLGQLDPVTGELKRAVEQMDAIYNRTKEEART